MDKRSKRKKAKSVNKPESEERLKVVKRPPYQTRLAEYVLSHGIKISWIAESMGMSYSKVYRYLVGETEPKVREGEALSRLLNCRLEDIFELEEPEKDGDDRLENNGETRSLTTLSGNCSSEYHSMPNSYHLVQESNSEEQSSDEESSGS